MLMGRTVGALCAVLAAAPVTAQYSLAGWFQAPATVTATAGGATQSNTFPLPGIGGGTVTQSAAVPGAAASIAYTARIAPSAVSWRMEHDVEVTVPGGAASTGPHSILVEVSSPTSVAGAVEVHYAAVVPPGFVTPTATVDIGDDGSVEFVNGVQVAPLPAMTIGPQPLQVGLLTMVDVTQPGQTLVDFEVRIKRENNLTITPAVIGCTPTTVVVDSAMAHDGVVLSRPDILPVGHFAMIGLAAQPVALPSVGGLPCVLLPSPDLAVFLGITQPYDIDLPAAVRPITFWVQSVVLDAGNVMTGGGFQVDAH